MDKPVRQTRRRTRAVGVVLAATTVALSGCAAPADRLTNGADAPFVLAGVGGVERVSQLTGVESPNATEQYGIEGTDLGSMFQFDGRTWFVFGDTFGEREEGFTGGGGSMWRSNTLAYSSDTDPTDGVTLDGMIVDDLGLAIELLPSKKIDNDEMTVIPTHGFAVGETMYLHWMSVRHWGEPGEWEVNEAGLASSTDKGVSWTVVDEPRWDGDSGFVQVAPTTITENGVDWLYFWGITHGRFGGVSLAKVKATEVEEGDSYLYLTGVDEKNSPLWSSDPAEVSIVVDDTVGELSVVWNDYLGRWIMTYLKEGTGVVMREGITPWGPWGNAVEVVSGTDVPGLYAPYMSETYTENGGKTIYFTLSVWDPYNVFWYKAELEKG